jgi:mxaK protein
MNAPPGPFSPRRAARAAPKRFFGARRRDGLTTALLLALLVAAFAFTAWSLADLVRARAVNDAIRALAAGQDVEIAEDAPSRLLVARGKFLLDRDRIEAAEALAPQLGATADAAAIGDFAHDLGNARLRAAFRLIEDNDITGATPLVRLAQEDFSQALRLDPARWDSKVNLDIASRLVRTFPRPAQEEQPGERPRNVWTDMPGLPRGLP